MARQPAFAPGDWVVGLVIHAGRIVVIHRETADRDYYVLPGGSIEAGETPMAACRREIKEETSLEAIMVAYLAPFTNRGRVEHYFRVDVVPGDLRLGGPELGRQATYNRYTPHWIDRALAEQLPIQPRETGALILGTAGGSKN